MFKKGRYFNTGGYYGTHTFKFTPSDMEKIKFDKVIDKLSDIFDSFQFKNVSYIDFKATINQNGGHVQVIDEFIAKYNSRGYMRTQYADQHEDEIIDIIYNKYKKSHNYRTFINALKTFNKKHDIYARANKFKGVYNVLWYNDYGDGGGINS